MIFSFRACSGLMFGILVGFEMFKRMNLSRSPGRSSQASRQQLCPEYRPRQTKSPNFGSSIRALVQLSSARNSVPLRTTYSLLEISILGPNPLLALQLFSVIGRSVHLALRKDKLPIAEFFQKIFFRGFHSGFSFQPKRRLSTIMPAHLGS